MNNNRQQFVSRQRSLLEICTGLTWFGDVLWNVRFNFRSCLVLHFIFQPVFAHFAEVVQLTLSPRQTSPRRRTNCSVLCQSFLLFTLDATEWLYFRFLTHITVSWSLCHATVQSLSVFEAQGTRLIQNVTEVCLKQCWTDHLEHFCEKTKKSLNVVLNLVV